MAEPKSYNIRDILDLLPHRYPFLLVDRVTEVIPGVSAKAYKNVSFNEPFFQGHFPGLPVMPGVLIIEAMAQTGTFIVLSDNDWTPEERAKKIFLFTGIDKLKFRRPVYPGDRLDLECTLTRHKLLLWKMESRALVNGQVCCHAELTAALNNREDM